MRILLLASLVATFAHPVMARQVQDWDVVRNPDRHQTLVYTQFDVGLSIAARCVGNSYQALIAGLPPVDTEQRPLGVAFGDGEIDDQTWNVTEDSRIALSSLPTQFARRLREGGTLKLRIPGGAEGGRNLLYVLDLPASNTAIDESLTACGRPLVDPRDEQTADIGDGSLPHGFSWMSRPRPEYPESRYASGFAVLSCLNDSDGRLRDCIIETEHPQDGGFGAAALHGVRRARVQATDLPKGPLLPRLIAFRVNFSLSDFEPLLSCVPSRSRRC
ncbi:hypothetical protein [uncultured Brevundimonas sp.]|uniref:hypothetical protein n=1 Tax=uncultured Brevundimonas sp. TaxID=213418 RepID=UPI0030EF236B|tara:strand:+ start:165 stop:986 length:822 start_codon:yes stop_codon:yes gene_type:complete